MIEEQQRAYNSAFDQLMEDKLQGELRQQEQQDEERRQHMVAARRRVRQPRLTTLEPRMAHDGRLLLVLVL